MYSKFPFSIEKIARLKSFGSLSLKFGCILAAVIFILYSIFQVSAELMLITRNQLSPDDEMLILRFISIIGLCIIHGVSFVLSVFMLMGALREKEHMIKPWVVWMSLQMLASIVMFVLWSTFVGLVSQINETNLFVYTAEFFILVLRFYMLLIVVSFCKQLEQAKEKTEKLQSLIKETWDGEA